MPIRHDELVTWAIDNAELIAKRIFGDWSKEERGFWMQKGTGSIPQFTSPKIVSMRAEHELAGGYPHERCYVDLAIELKIDILLENQRGAPCIGKGRGWILCEIKPEIKSLDALIREVRQFEKLRPYGATKVVVVSNDPKHKRFLEGQGFEFILVQGKQLPLSLGDDY